MSKNEFDVDILSRNRILSEYLSSLVLFSREETPDWLCAQSLDMWRWFRSLTQVLLLFLGRYSAAPRPAHTLK